MSHSIGKGRKHDYGAVLSYIIAYKQAHDGNSPTFREIGVTFGIDTPSVTTYILERLQRDGKIRLEGGKQARQIVVIGGHWSMA